MQKATLSFSSEEDEFIGPAESLAPPRSQALRVALNPYNGCSERCPTSSLCLCSEPGEKVDVAKDKKVSPRARNAETFREDNLDEVSGNIWGVLIIMMMNRTISKTFCSSRNTIRGVSD